MTGTIIPSTPAQRLANRLGELEDLYPPVDVRQLIEKSAKVVEVDVPDDINADAIVVIGSSSKVRSTVLLNSRRPVSRQRFTLAHELGHIVIPWHLGSIACTASSGASEDAGLYNQFEREANDFASWLLLPRPWLATEVVDSGLDVPGILDRLAVAKVSAEAGIIALREFLPQGHVLSLLDGDDVVERSFRSPGTLVNAPAVGDHLESLDRLALIAESHGVKVHQRRRVAWWFFGNERPIEAPTFPSRAALQRELRAVEAAILSRAGLSERQQSLAGVLGFANTTSGQGLSQIAAAIQQRLASHPEFSVILDDEDYGRWAQLKAALFASRPAQRSTRG